MLAEPFWKLSPTSSARGPRRARSSFAGVQNPQRPRRLKSFTREITALPYSISAHIARSQPLDPRVGMGLTAIAARQFISQLAMRHRRMIQFARIVQRNCLGISFGNRESDRIPIAVTR